MNIDNERNVTVNVDARPPKRGWLAPFIALSLLFGVLLELVAIEKHLRLIADAQAMQAMGSALPAPAPEAAPSAGPRLHVPNRIAQR